MRKIKTIIVATRNEGKMNEFRQALKDLFEKIYFLPELPFFDDLKEDETSYVSNAMKKARKVGERFGIPSIADDSGLEVDFLGGRPGVTSSRYGKNDEERIGRLLTELEGLPWDERTAKFRAYLALYLPEPERYYVFYGDLKGIIGFEKRGEYGFGFDPVFFVPSIGKYLSELDTHEKNRISHRGKALMALKEFLRSL